MPFDPHKALYIHIPFCLSRCNYCDFATESCESDSKHVRKYLDNLMFEMRESSKKGLLSEIETVYIGGGTPTHLGHKQLVELLYFLSTMLYMKNVKEFTIEANPESLTEEIVKDAWALGVNRISIGVQSFDDGVLNALGRAHDSDRAKQAVEVAKLRFENVSVDLMCGLPGQTESMWQKDLETAVSLGVKHISVYPLTIEEHTPFYKQCMKGQMSFPDEDLQADMMNDAERILKPCGFERYEVASYAISGFESRHNISYWTGVPYLGFGRSAASMTQNDQRRMRIQDGVVTDDLNRAQMEAEDIMLMFRMSKGVGDSRIFQASNYLPELQNTLENLIEKGLIEHVDGRYVPTNKGWLCGNELYGEIFDLA